MNSPAHGLELWLRRLALRTSLDAADRRMVLDLPGRVERVRPNHDFVRLGERNGECCLIVEGIAGRFGQTREGLRQLTALHIPGDMADLHSAVLPQAASALSAISEVVVYRVPHAAMHGAVQRSDRLARAVWRDCTVDAAILGEWLTNNGRRNARARLAHLICEMALRFEAIGADRCAFTFDISQVHLADALSLTSVHVNRTLRELREQGLLMLQGRDVRIHDWDALAQAGDFDPHYLHLQREHPDTGERGMRAASSDFG